MAKQFPSLTPKLIEFIERQKVFFVGTARSTGRVNISPKGLDSLRVINENKIVWLNLTGSGNETAIHLQENDRMTIMFCSFEKNPLILRLYGTAKAYHPDSELFKKQIALFPNFTGRRQIFEVNLNMVQTSCGYAVPFMEFYSERDTLDLSWKKKGQQAAEDYWAVKNAESIDGFKSSNFLNE